MQVKRIRLAGGGIGDRNFPFAHLARVVLEPETGRLGHGRACDLLQTQVVTHDVAVGSQLHRRRELRVRQVGSRCLSAHVDDVIGY